MSNTSPLQKSGMQMLLGRERYEALMAEAERVGLSMATVVRTGIDVWMAQPEAERHYEGEMNKKVGAAATTAPPRDNGPAPSEVRRPPVAPRGVKPEASPFRPSIPGMEDEHDDEGSMGAMFRAAIANKQSDQ